MDCDSCGGDDKELCDECNECEDCCTCKSWNEISGRKAAKFTEIKPVGVLRKHYR